MPGSWPPGREDRPSGSTRAAREKIDGSRRKLRRKNPARLKPASLRRDGVGELADVLDLDGDLEPDPKVFIDAAATCDPVAGITYVITTHHSPDNATGIEMQWMDDNGATSQNLAEQDTVPSGEGVFDVRALLHTTTEFYASNWQEVVVECDTDLPLRGTPDFTG